MLRENFSEWQVHQATSTLACQCVSPLWWYHPPGKPTWQWNIHHLKMCFQLKMGIFQCRVSFQGCTISRDAKWPTLTSPRRICDSHWSICSIHKFKLYCKNPTFFEFSAKFPTNRVVAEQQKFENPMGRLDSKVSHIQFPSPFLEEPQLFLYLSPWNLRPSRSGDKKNWKYWSYPQGAYFWKRRGRWTGEKEWNLFIGTLPETLKHRTRNLMVGILLSLVALGILAEVNC